LTISHARRAGVGAVLALALLAIGATQAQAHAVVSPPAPLSGRLQQFTLSVPTEKESATTTKIELDVPAGFSIDSYAPSPGWTRTVAAKGSGDGAVVQKVVWSGGRVPTGEDAVFQFNAEATNAQSYTFHVVQTYSDGSVVDWSGPESSDTPAPVVDAKSSVGGGSSTLGVIALIVAGVALVVAIVGLAGGRRPLT
jgi:uncharacterized protein YcnI